MPLAVQTRLRGRALGIGNVTYQYRELSPPPGEYGKLVSWVPDLQTKAHLIEPTLLQRAEKLPQSGYGLVLSAISCENSY